MQVNLHSSLGSNFQKRFKYNFIIRDRTFLFECKNQLFPSPLFWPSSGYYPAKYSMMSQYLLLNSCQTIQSIPHCLWVSTCSRGEFYVTEQEKIWFYHQVPEYVTHCDYMLPSDQGSPLLPSPPTPDHSTP